MFRHVARTILATALLCTTAVVTQAIPAEATAPINGKISFAREPDTEGGGALFTMDPDGTDAVQVGTGEGLQWSPDGNQLAFACFPLRPDRVAVCTVAPDGSDLVHVVPKTGGLADPPIDFYPTAWSPDGRRLLIDAGAGLSTNGAGILTMRPDGSRLSRVTSTATEQFPYGFSPDGSRIVFGQYDADGTTDLFVVRTDGTGLTRLNPPSLAIDSQAEWSPDGRRIVFSALWKSSGGGTGNALYTVRPDGSGLTRITPSGIGASHPRWSPDGRLIAFEFGVWPEIALVHPDGTGLRQITSPSDGLAFDPVWSPDGTKLLIAYARFDRNGAFSSQLDLWIINADGTGLLQLTDTPEFEEPSGWGVSSVTP